MSKPASADSVWLASSLLITAILTPRFHSEENSVCSLVVAFRWRVPSNSGPELLLQQLLAIAPILLGPGVLVQDRYNGISNRHVR